MAVEQKAASFLDARGKWSVAGRSEGVQGIRWSSR